MRIRRSILAFLISSALLLSVSLLVLLSLDYVPVLPLTGSGGTTDKQAYGTPFNLGNIWPAPEPGDDTLRKHPYGVSNPPHNVSQLLSLSSDVLRHHLQTFLEAPALTHAEAVVKNEEACPRSLADEQVNQDQFNGQRENWMAVSVSDIRKRREAIVRHLEQLEKEGTVVMGDKSGAGEGRGIVMTAGNKDTAQTALVTLHMLKQYESKLPVQIFSFPGEIEDPMIIKAIRDLGASHHELTGLQKVPGAWKNFHLKANAILNSTFTEVLYLDSDNVPLRDPAYLFDEPLYKDGGRAVFWPDYNKDHPNNAIWRVLGRTCSYHEWEVESGQILIDKRGNGGLNLAALHIASHMQANHDFWFTLAGGDKDTFRYAFWALDIRYATSPRWLSALGSVSSPDETGQQDRFCGTVMLQYDIAADGKGRHLPLFLHANLLKHRFVGRGKERKLFQTIKRASRDDANEPSLNRARMFVYTDRGLCVDLEMDMASNNEGGVAPEQRMVTEQFEVVYEGMFRDFEDQWLRAGGKQGGW